MRTYKLKKCKNINGIHFSPDGARLLVIGGWEVRGIDTVIWLDIASGESANRSDVRAEHYTIPRDGSKLIVGGSYYCRDNALLRLSPLPDLDDWQPIQLGEGLSPRGTTGLSYLFALSTDSQGQLLAVANGYISPQQGSHEQIHYRLSLLRFDSGECVVAIPQTRRIGQIALSLDAKRMVVSGGIDGEPRVVMYELPQGNELWSFDPPGTRTRRLTFAPDGRLAVANARKVYIVPSDGPKGSFELAGHKGQINAISFAPGGERLLTASQDGGIKIWNSRTGDLVTTFDWGIGAVRAISFSPDGLTCAAGGENGQVVIWDVEE